ncbi:MAG: hypothetical protein M1834_007025 [Cirrosporium novae-zelandiae]|nr:MAG: hypothetical protein M1834_007025 [Cirrosporium novae-zelandiae]
MTARLMRKVSETSINLVRSTTRSRHVLNTTPPRKFSVAYSSYTSLPSRRISHETPPYVSKNTISQTVGTIETATFPKEKWFTPSTVVRGSQKRNWKSPYKVNNAGNTPSSGLDVNPSDKRTVKLGKTLRILQSRLPTLLNSPLPSEILSPHIQLHMFPSTHPNLPTVSGRMPYTAALWTAPVAWGRVPLIGNVKLDILSERMVKNFPRTLSESGKNWSSNDAVPERLIVRWKTASDSPSNPKSTSNSKIAEWLGGRNKDDGSFTGLFIFEFDEEGRILTHTIEQVQDGGSWEMEPRFVGLTDWLLRGWRRRGGAAEGGPGLAMYWDGISGPKIKRK